MIGYVFLSAFALCLSFSAAQCPFRMMSGDVTPTEAYFQATLRDPSCRSTDYSDYAVAKVIVSMDKDFSTLIYEDEIVTKKYGGDDPRTDPGEYVARVYLTNLSPATTYYYRFFDENGVASPIGTVITLPSGQDTDEVNFVHISCANINPYPISGALRDYIVNNKPQFNIFNGDVIYADRVWYQGGPDNDTNRCCRFPNQTLQYYYEMYDQQREDAYTGEGFHEALYSTPTFMLWDDHEVTDDFAGNNAHPRILFRNPSTDELIQDVSPDDAIDYTNYGRNAFFTMNALPTAETLSLDQVTDVFDPKIRIFRKFRVGKDVEIFILDLRTYREPLDYVDIRVPVKPQGVPDNFSCTPPGFNQAICDQLASGGFIPNYRERLGTRRRDLMGSAQREWLKNGLLESTAKFKIIISSVVVLEFFYNPPDRWEGYWKERVELLDFIEQNNIENVVILTGDYHASIFSQVNPGKTPPVYEFTTGSIGALPRIIGTPQQFYDWLTYYGGNGHLFPAGQRPVKYMYHQDANFMSVNVKDGKLTVKTYDRNGEVATDLGGVRGEFVLE